MVLEVGTTDTVGWIRECVAERTGLRAANMVLTSGTAVLSECTQTLDTMGLSNGSVLCARGRLLGGGGKKKAKVMPKVVAKERIALPTTFLCPFCDHKTISCRMYALLPPVDALSHVHAARGRGRIAPSADSAEFCPALHL
jgi:hypothetical protein